jgi:hypothetical protein
MPKTALELELDSALADMLARNDRLEAELKRVQARLDGLVEAFEKGGSLGILQRIAADKTLPAELRVRAAGLAVPYEVAKPPSTSTVKVVSLFDILERNRLKDLEAREKAQKTIEGSLASDHGGGPLAGPEADPAA